MTVGQRIKELRESKGISVIELANKLNVSRATIYRYESHEIEKFPVDILEPISNALGCSPAYLMGWTDDPSPNFIKDNFCHLKEEYQQVTAASSLPVHFENNGGVIEEVSDEQANDDQIKKAMELYKKYKEAIPQVQNAVDALLKPSQPDP